LQVIPGFKGQYRFQKLTMFTPDDALHRIKPRAVAIASRWRGESGRMLAYRMQIIASRSSPARRLRPHLPSL
jgi:hypothetical protein